jgi:hypothetical protein
MHDRDEERRLLESEIERRLAEFFAELREEFERLRLESDGRWAGFASRFEKRITGIVPEELFPEREEPSAPGQLSIAAARELDGAANQVEILHRLLEACRRQASRAILLVLKNGAWTVWKASGFAGGVSAQEAVRQVTLPATAEGPLARVLAGTPCRLAAANEVSARLSCEDAADAVVVPMTIRDKVSGAVYADAARGEEYRFDPEAIALLTYLAGLLIERLPARKLRPSPTLKEIEHPGAPPQAPSSTAEYETRMLSLWQEPADAVREEQPQPSVASVREATPGTAAGTRRLTGPLAPPDEEEQLQPSVASVREAAPGTAAGTRRLTGPLAPPDEDEQHAEARRFAELLVSEIKLYNERAVREGREQGNLYKRLKEEIDLSRQMYEQRIPEAVRAGSDFLQEELVRILADGRPEALGM